MRIGRYGDGCGRDAQGLTLARVQAAEHGIDLGPLRPALPGIIATATGRIELAPPRMLADLPRLSASLGEDPVDTLRLINRREARSMNSWLHNLPMLAKGRDRCTLQIHPRDAQRRQIVDGQPVRLHSRVGTLDAPAEVTEAVMPGVVSLPHGFGHQTEPAGLRVASARPGVNVNRLSDDQAVDRASGAIALFGLPVTASALPPSGSAQPDPAFSDAGASPPEVQLG